MSSSFLYNLTRSASEQVGFTHQRPKGKGNCVMPSPSRSAEPAARTHHDRTLRHLVRGSAPHIPAVRSEWVDRKGRIVSNYRIGW